MLIVASQLGLETILAFGEEARSHKLLVRASLAGVAVLGGLLTVCAWALAALTGVDHLDQITADTVFGALGDHLGYFVLVLAQMLLVSSILAALISVHQTVARYVFGLSRESVLPAAWGRVRRGQGVPFGGSLAQSAVGLAVIVVWALLGVDPMVLFNWAAALAAVGLMTVMVTACAAAWRFFHRGGGGSESVFTRMIAPVAGMLAMGGLLAVTVANLHVLVGAAPGSAVVWLLPALVAGGGQRGPGVGGGGATPPPRPAPRAAASPNRSRSCRITSSTSRSDPWPPEPARWETTHARTHPARVAPPRRLGRR